jgi:hypothetical protein
LCIFLFIVIYLPATRRILFYRADNIAYNVFGLTARLSVTNPIVRAEIDSFIFIDNRCRRRRRRRFKTARERTKSKSARPAI